MLCCFSVTFGLPFLGVFRWFLILDLNLCDVCFGIVLFGLLRLVVCLVGLFCFRLVLYSILILVVAV